MEGSGFQSVETEQQVECLSTDHNFQQAFATPVSTSNGDKIFCSKCGKVVRI